jgi:uncharacterized protein DUF3857
MFHKTLTIIFLVIAACASVALAGDDAPDWLRQLASQNPGTYEKSVKAVVLLKEQSITLDGNGKLITSDRYAVRVLTREGRKEAVAVIPYLSNFTDVRDFQGWLIAPGGTVSTYGKKDIIDQISDPEDIYNETRLKIIDGSLGADVGYVFGYTVTRAERPLAYQDDFVFQDELPTLDSRYTLALPNGWKATSMTFNHAEIAPQVNGSSYTWELRSLSPIADEPMRPSFRNLAPRIAVNYSPADSAQAVNRAFTDWVDVSKWTSAMYDPQVVIDDALAAKTRDLTAGAKTELDMIRAIGKYVQNMQYIAVDIGVGYGNGMRPRPSNEVFNRGYADCKNKANLMRAMLKVMKIDSFPVPIYSGDPNYVKKEWPSPFQFNHCIIAIKVSDATNAPTVINHSKLGRLLIFDATDEYTPVGDLPDYLQGSYGLIAAGENGGIVQMPVTPPDFNAWNRETEVSIDGSGGIQGTIHERTTGQESRPPRTAFRSMPAGEFSKMIEGWLSRGATAAKLVKLSPTDRQADAAFDMDVEFSAPAYGQLMQQRLLVFKPAVANRSASVYLTEKDRKLPVVLESNSFNEKVTFNLPTGFVVDEMPDPVKLETPFGKYSTSYDVKDGKLLFTRSLTMNRGTVGVDKYDDVRNFFSKVRDAEQAPVVLLRK